MKKDLLRQSYTEQIDAFSIQIAWRKRRNRWFITGEIASFLLFIALLVAMTHWGITPVWVLASALSLLLYAVIRRRDVLNEERIAWLEALKKVNERERAYLDGDFSQLDNGEKYTDTNHPFTYDMDVFGRESLFQRISRTVTTGGSDELARRLSTVKHSLSFIKETNEAVEEMASRFDFRADFMAAGMTDGVDTHAIRRTLSEARQMNIASLALSPFVFAVACCGILGLVAAILLSAMSVVSYQLPLWWGLIQFFTVLLSCMAPLRKISKVCGNLLRQLKAYSRLVRQLSRHEGFCAAANRHDSEVLSKSMESLSKLENILSALDRRGNVLGLVLFNTFLLSDYFLIRRFLKWQHAHFEAIDVWTDALIRMDVHVSMGTFRHNEPQTTYASVEESERLVYQANGFWHPFIGEKAVKNDFDIAHRHYYIVTGANMAGKSTFLRSLGVNYILAMNGLPVFAEQLTVSPFKLFTGMRTTDDLAHGISYFNAELRRLSRLLAFISCQQAEENEMRTSPDRQQSASETTDMPTLIILDEILKGTNSLDKLNGSRLFLESILPSNATGIIATHDLELSKMADSHPQRYHNYCFEIGLATQITYTYKITEGVARNQNATFLLREMIEKSGAK